MEGFLAVHCSITGAQVHWYCSIHNCVCVTKELVWLSVLQGKPANLEEQWSYTSHQAWSTILPTCGRFIRERGTSKTNACFHFRSRNNFDGVRLLLRKRPRFHTNAETLVQLAPISIRRSSVFMTCCSNEPTINLFYCASILLAYCRSPSCLYL